MQTTNHIPIGSMYGIFTYIYHKHQLNVGEYTIHGWYGIFLNMFSDLIILFTYQDMNEYFLWERSRIPYHSALLGRWFSFLKVGYVSPVDG